VRVGVKVFVGVNALHMCVVCVCMCVCVLARTCVHAVWASVNRCQQAIGHECPGVHNHCSNGERTRHVGLRACIGKGAFELGAVLSGLHALRSGLLRCTRP